jgi:ABC-type phosphate transport system permease subunit
LSGSTTKQQAVKEFTINLLIKAAGYSAILFVGMIFLFLLLEGFPALQQITSGLYR